MFYKRKIIVACSVVKWKKRPNLGICFEEVKVFNKREKVSLHQHKLSKDKNYFKRKFCSKTRFDPLLTKLILFFFEKMKITTHDEIMFCDYEFLVNFVEPGEGKI